jgi:hypothetical protein
MEMMKMNVKKTLVGILLGASLYGTPALSQDYSKHENASISYLLENGRKHHWNGLLAVAGKPTGVFSYTGGNGGGVGTSISFVIEDKNGNPLVCRFGYNKHGTQDIGALIQAEKDDGDDEQILVHGVYDADEHTLNVNSVRVKGYAYSNDAVQVYEKAHWK